VVVAITNEKPAEARPFLKEHPFPFPVLYDQDAKAGQAYSVGGIPVTCIVDRDGKLIRRVEGFDEGLFQKEIISGIATLLDS
jgi:peroxiredoxin